MNGSRTKTLCIAFTLSSLLVGCATDEATPGAEDDSWTRPPEAVPGDGKVVEPSRPMGFPYATPVQRKRILEAALGVDTDRAVSQADALRGRSCPSEEPIDGGVLLRGGCQTGGLRIEGTATITGTPTGDRRSYRFDHFVVRLNGGRDTYDGGATFESRAGNRDHIDAYTLKVSRSFAAGDEADQVITTSTGTWANDGAGKVTALSYWFPTYPALQMAVGVDGVGRYWVSGSSLSLDTQAGSVMFNGSNGFGASSDGHGACWSFHYPEAVLDQSCDLDSLTALDPH